MYIDVMSCLFRGNVTTHQWITQIRKRKRRSHRISGDDLERCFEIAGHVCLYEVTDVWFLLNVCGENGVSEELCLDGRARETRKSTERAVDGNIT